MSGRARLFRHQQNHGARISSRITGIPDLPHFPLATDLQRNVRRRALSDVSQRDNGNLATRFISDVLGHARHSLDRRWIENVREIVDDSGWRRDRQRLLCRRGQRCAEEKDSKPNP